MKILPSDIRAPEVLRLFSAHDDFMIDFLGEDSVYYTRYSAGEKLQAVWVAYDGEAPVGCAAYRKKSRGVGELKRMFVKGEYRGRGISKALLTAVEEYARQRGDRALYLDTRVTLEPAMTLYRRAGFVEVARNGLYVELQKKL